MLLNLTDLYERQIVILKDIHFMYLSIACEQAWYLGTVVEDNGKKRAYRNKLDF